MPDFILVNDLRITTICGALPEEKVRAQPFRFDIEVEADLSAAGQTDDLNQTIHYGELTDQVVAAITAQPWILIERMAQVVADVALSFHGALAVTVEVRKLRPPVAHALDSTAVRITRRAAA